MKKKLLITVGAGASIDFGLPSVSDIDLILDVCAQRHYPLISEPASNLYGYIRDAINAYYQSCEKPSIRKSANFEEVLYQLNMLAPYLSDTNKFHGSNALLSCIELPEIRDSTGACKRVDGDYLASISNFLMDTLIDRFIDLCGTVDLRRDVQINELRGFIDALKDEFEIGIITLNYDNIFTQACPDLFTGFDLSTGKFDPMAVHRRQEGNFIYHLHGSIHFALKGGGHSFDGIKWVQEPKKNDSIYATGRSGQNSLEGIIYPKSPIIAGYGKSQQILRQPFHTYFAQINRLVHEADNLLFLGYGFGDFHLNSAFSEARDKRKPVVIVDWADDDQDPLSLRQDNWSHNLYQTLPYDKARMGRSGSESPAIISELKQIQELEVSNNNVYPLAIWYNGMLAACRAPDKIIQQLQ